VAFAPAIRRLTFATHGTSSAGWVGAVLVFLALASIALISEDERTVRGAYLVMAPAAWLVLVPLAHASVPVQLGLVRNPSPVRHAALALILLLIATWLAVYRPFGVTPYARRINRQGLGVISAAAVPPSAIPPNSATGDTHLGVCHRLCRTRGDARGRAPALERYQLRPLAAQTVLTSRGAVRQAAGMSRMNRGSVCR
jgi:hypothetical protein